jgi:hypothetical protein
VVFIKFKFIVIGGREDVGRLENRIRDTGERVVGRGGMACYVFLTRSERFCENDVNVVSYRACVIQVRVS